MTDPEWVRDVIWWQVYPLGFLGATDGRAEPAPRLRRLEPWLDELLALGANGLALGPIFASSTHGYDTVDHLQIDPRLGTGDDFDALVRQCRERGIRLLLDGVFNHVGRDFFAFRDVRENGRESHYANWFHIDWDADGADGFGYQDFEGHWALVALNHDEPQVVDFVTRVMRHWLDRGADGWRLDAAYAVPLDFWAAVSAAVRETHPEVWLVGEVIHGDYPAFATRGGLNSVTAYELWKAIWSSLNDVNFFELDWTLRRHAELTQVLRAMTFVGNHDVTRIASQLTDERLLPLALVVLFTAPGVPSVYAGDEHAFRGVKEDREGGDDAVRPAFPDRPGDLRGGDDTRSLHQELIGLRRRHRWLHAAQLEVVEVANAQIGYRLRSGDENLLVLLHAADGPAHFEIGAAELIAGSESARGVPGVIDGIGWAVLTE